MINLYDADKHVQNLATFQELVSTPFRGDINVICWKRKLVGDFSEIVNKIVFQENMTAVSQEQLLGLQLSEQGNLAREIILNDLQLLQAHGASPVLNLIKHYEKDGSFFPTDVYSWHVDRSPVPTDTFLCTYHGESSEILPNAQGLQKVHIPEIRKKLFQLYDGPESGFESFLTAYFFDLHYQAEAKARPIGLGIGHLWKLAVDHPESAVLPCLHRAPEEKDGKIRLMLIC